MRIGVVSDSHGETANLHEAVHHLVRQHGVELLIHLGDDYQDAVALGECGVPVVQVPGTWDDEYQDDVIANRRFEQFEGWRFFLSHTRAAHKNDRPSDRNPSTVIARGEADVLLHGHTHIPRVDYENAVALVNPGHLKSHDKKGFEPSYAVLGVTPDAVEVCIVALRPAQPLAEHRIERATR